MTLHTDAPILAQYAPDSTDWFLGFRERGDFLCFGINAAGSYEEWSVPTHPTNFNDGFWHHIAATYDGMAKRLYRDGVEIASTPKSGAMSTRGTIHKIGQGRTGEVFWDTLDELAIYDRALAADEIRALYEAESIGRCVDRPLTLSANVLTIGAIGLSWESVAGRLYHVEWTAQLAKPAWEILLGPVVSTGGVINLSVPPTNPQQFYRLKEFGP